jgi:lactate permease
MTLLLQAAPLLALLLLLATGRAGPVGACLVALGLAVPAALASLPAGTGLGGFLAAEALRGGFLALQPVAVVAGGLLFHAAVSGGEAAAARPATAARVFAVTLPLGAFLESVTGFAVGAVFALSALRGMGIAGAVGGALALQALVLVPWGGLGPGTALGAALAGLPGHDVALVAAWPNAAWLVLLAPLLWALMARAGVVVPGREKLAQLGVLGLIAAVLLLANLYLPFEIAGVLATGVGMVVALWWADPPQGWRGPLRAAAPYLVLTAGILLARLWSSPPALRPFAEFPGFPLTHVAVVLWLVALGLLWRGGTLARVAPALARARRPAVAMLLYVLLGRVLAGSGAAAGLASALAEAMGPLAPYAVPVMGLVSGVVTGSNVGSNAALTSIQVGLGQAAGLPPALAPGLHNFSGGAGAGMSFGVTAMLCGLLADGTRPMQVWRLVWPSMLLVVVLGWAAVAVLR